MAVQNPNILHPHNYRGQLLPSSRQASSNTSEGGANRESSLDDSGVVDDHDEQDIEFATIPMIDVSSLIIGSDYFQFESEAFSKAGPCTKNINSIGRNFKTFFHAYFPVQTLTR